MANGSNSKAIIVYDEDNDILSIGKEGEVEASIDIGDFILDIGDKGSVIGIEIIDVSKVYNIPKKVFSHIKEGTFRVMYHRNYILVMAVLHFEEEKELNISVPLYTNRALLTA